MQIPSKSSRWRFQVNGSYKRFEVKRFWIRFQRKVSSQASKFKAVGIFPGAYWLKRGPLKAGHVAIGVNESEKPLQLRSLFVFLWRKRDWQRSFSNDPYVPLSTRHERSMPKERFYKESDFKCKTLEEFRHVILYALAGHRSSVVKACIFLIQVLVCNETLGWLWVKRMIS